MHKDGLAIIAIVLVGGIARFPDGPRMADTEVSISYLGGRCQFLQGDLLFDYPVFADVVARTGHSSRIIIHHTPDIPAKCISAAVRLSKNSRYRYRLVADGPSVRN